MIRQFPISVHLAIALVLLIVALPACGLDTGSVETVDERLTSEQAHRALSEAGATNRVRDRNVDRMAAQLILQRYLEARRRTPRDEPQDRASAPEQ